MAALQITSELVKAEHENQQERNLISGKLEQLEQQLDFIKP
jgi:hypothetical protein